MAVLTNSFEGGTSGSTITSGNSGGSSGDAFGAVTIDSGNSLTFDNAQHAHGSMAAKVSTGATSGSAYVSWTSGIPGTSPTLWARAYYRFGANPAAAVNVLRMLSSSNGIMGTIRVNANGTIGMLYGTGTLGGTSAGAITSGAWWRVEVMVTAGTTTGVMVVRLYFTPDAGTPDETLTSTNVNTGAVNPSRSRVGVVSNLANVAAFHLDDLGLGDVDWLGAAGGGPAPITGSVSAALPRLAAAGAVLPRDSATAVSQLPPLTAQAAAALGTPGTLTAALPALGTTLTAEARLRGALAAALPALGAAVEGRGRAGAALAGTLPPLTATLDAVLIAPGTGHLAARLPALAAASSTTTTAPAALAAALPALTGSAETRPVSPAALSAALPTLAPVVEAGAPTISGTLDAALPRLTAAGASRTVTRAALAAVLPALTARVTSQPPTAPLAVTIGAPRLRWAPGAPAVTAWAVGAPSVRRYP